MLINGEVEFFCSSFSALRFFSTIPPYTSRREASPGLGQIQISNFPAHLGEPSELKATLLLSSVLSGASLHVVPKVVIFFHMVKLEPHGKISNELSLNQTPATYFYRSMEG